MFKKILIYNSGGGIGDSILLIPLILSLKDSFKNVEIYYLGAHENHFEDKLKEYGMTFIFAGTEADDDSKLHTVIHFESEAHLQRFHQDEELTLRRAEAGAIVETGTFTPISNEAFTNYPSALHLK